MKRLKHLKKNLNNRDDWVTLNGFARQIRTRSSEASSSVSLNYQKNNRKTTVTTNVGRYEKQGRTVGRTRIGLTRDPGRYITTRPRAQQKVELFMNS